MAWSLMTTVFTDLPNVMDYYDVDKLLPENIKDGVA